MIKIYKYMVRVLPSAEGFDCDKTELVRQLNYNTMAEIKDFCYKTGLKLIRAEKYNSFGYLYYIAIPKEAINHLYDVHIGFLA